MGDETRMVDEGIKPGFGWAQVLEDEASFVLHVPTWTIAQVRKFHDGVERIYRNPDTDVSVKGPVLEFADGSSRCCEQAGQSLEAAFVQLSPDELRGYLAMQAAVGTCIKQCAEQAARSGMRQGTALLLLGVALRMSAGIVDAAGRVAGKGG